MRSTAQGPSRTPTERTGHRSRSTASDADVAGLFTYVVRYDIGFAPDPFHGRCTLATCKPGIRKASEPGDWVAGIGSKQKGQEGLLVFCMHVDEAVSYDEYWADPRFQRKKPNRVGSLKQRYGDNIYHRASPDDPWIQEDSRHSLDDGAPNTDHIKRDTSAPRVLIASRFSYFGDQAIDIPPEFRDWDGHDICQGGRGYKRNFPSELFDAFIAWLDSIATEGIAGEPLDWP